jgi:hypothetical protein
MHVGCIIGDMGRHILSLVSKWAKWVANLGNIVGYNSLREEQIDFSFFRIYVLISYFQQC